MLTRSRFGLDLVKFAEKLLAITASNSDAKLVGTANFIASLAPHRFQNIVL